MSLDNRERRDREGNFQSYFGLFLTLLICSWIWYGIYVDKSRTNILNTSEWVKRNVSSLLVKK